MVKGLGAVASPLCLASTAALAHERGPWLKADLLMDKPIRAERLRTDVNRLLNRATA